MTTWPPPLPAPPGEPRRTPWQPEPRPPVSPPPTQITVVETGQDWLAERLLDRRMVTLTGRLSPDAANRAAATLALLDASGDDRVELRLCDVDADLDVALTLLDTLDLMGVPVHATYLGTLTGAAVVILAVAEHRTAGRYATLHLREPRTQRTGHATGVAGHAEDHRRRLRLLQERIADGCHRTVDTVAADVAAHRILTAEQAYDYGLVDVITTTSPSRHPPVPPTP